MEQSSNHTLHKVWKMPLQVFIGREKANVIHMLFLHIWPPQNSWFMKIKYEMSSCHHKFVCWISHVTMKRREAFACIKGGWWRVNYTCRACSLKNCIKGHIKEHHAVFALACMNMRERDRHRQKKGNWRGERPYQISNGGAYSIMRVTVRYSSKETCGSG